MKRTYHIEQSILFLFNMIPDRHQVLSRPLIGGNGQQFLIVIVVVLRYKILVTKDVLEFTQELFGQGMNRTFQGIDGFIAVSSRCCCWNDGSWRKQGGGSHVELSA